MIGLIPEGGGAKTVARGLGHLAGYRGIVADVRGGRMIRQANNEASVHGVGEGISAGDAAEVGLGVAGFIPVLGQVAALGSVIYDGYKTVKAMQACR